MFFHVRLRGPLFKKKKREEISRETSYFPSIALASATNGGFTKGPRSKRSLLFWYKSILIPKPL